MNDKFIYYPYIYGKENATPTSILSRNQSMFTKTKETFGSYDELKNMNITGFIYDGEKGVLDNKKYVVSLYFKNKQLNCEILKVMSESKENIEMLPVFQFTVDNEIIIKNTNLGIIDCFTVFNLLTNKTEFKFYYWHPYNRTIWYDMFEDMSFKELAEKYKSKEWLEDLQSHLKN